VGPFSRTAWRRHRGHARSGRVFHVVVTPDDLDMLRVAIGGLPHLFRYVTERLGSMPDDCGFLVYTQYDLEPSTARQLPSAPDLREVREDAGSPTTQREPPRVPTDRPSRASCRRSPVSHAHAGVGAAQRALMPLSEWRSLSLRSSKAS
jgi:hypothetical protein